MTTLADWIASHLATAPPLSDDAREQLGNLLRGGDG